MKVIAFVTKYFISCKQSTTTTTVRYVLDKEILCPGSSVTTNMEMGVGMRVDEADDGAPAMNIEAEGAILLSTTRVNRTFVFQQLRQTVERLRLVGAIR